MNSNYSTSFNQEHPLARKTFFWFRIYAILLALIYVASILFGTFLLIAQPKTSTRDEAEIFLTGILLTVFGLPFLILSIVGVFLPKRRWAWVYGLALICIGMTSCCFLPITIPLLINWIKPETKALFGR